MKATIIAFLATAAMAAPAFAANNTANQPQPPAQTQQQKPQNTSQQQSQNAPQNAQQQNQNQAANQPLSPNSLNHNEIRQMQAALDKNGFNAGRPDGKWGPHTRQAVQKFDHSKGIQSNNGQPTEQTLAQLGLNANQNQQQPQNTNQQKPNGQ